MAKRSTTKVSNIQVKPVKVSVRLLLNVKYRYTLENGETVEWNGAGSIQSVPQSDALVLLTKVRAGGCCGEKPRPQNIFTEV